MQVACFDTAFHAGLPTLAKLTSLPRELAGNDIRRYGFHGISYEFVVDELRRRGASSKERLIVAHLGSGASMAAIRSGRSIETTMGFSTLSGMPMATRCGDLDPGILLFLLMERKLSPEAVQEILYERSGLLGISGITSDMRELLEQAHRPEAAEAIDYYCTQARAHLCALAAALGGVDRLVFTAGIGANSPEIRARICAGLEFLGIEVDGERNRSGHRRISREDSRVLVEAFPTNEELIIARHTVGVWRHQTNDAAPLSRPARHPSGTGEHRVTETQLTTDLLDEEELRRIDAYWRAANYLSVGQIYLLDNPLLREPLTLEHVKPRLLGHWGTTPGLNFIYAHLNRVIKARDLNVIYVCGPGHGGPAWSPTPISKAPTARSIRMSRRTKRACESCSGSSRFPGGIPSHAAPETPGSIHEGGELGYALAHAYGAAFDNPDLIVACVVGDGEAETGPLATAWHSNKFLNPVTRRRGAADPAPQRLQDRQPDRPRRACPTTSCAASSSATATSRSLSRAKTRRPRIS